MVPTSPGAWPFWPGCCTGSVCRQFMSRAHTSSGTESVSQRVTFDRADSAVN